MSSKERKYVKEFHTVEAVLNVMPHDTRATPRYRRILYRYYLLYAVLYDSDSYRFWNFDLLDRTKKES